MRTRTTGVPWAYRRWDSGHRRPLQAPLKDFPLGSSSQVAATDATLGAGVEVESVATRADTADGAGAFVVLGAGGPAQIPSGEGGGDEEGAPGQKDHPDSELWPRGEGAGAWKDIKQQKDARRDGKKAPDQTAQAHGLAEPAGFVSLGTGAADRRSNGLTNRSK